MTPGSVYRQSDRIADLLAEPTFDVGGDPNAIYFYSFQVPHYDADGHGLFDIPMVISEQLCFAPTWVFSDLLYATGSESFLDPRRPPGTGALAKLLGPVRGTIAYSLVVPGVVSYFGGLTEAMALDLMMHDVPVIFIGRPIRWVGELASGR